MGPRPTHLNLNDHNTDDPGGRTPSPRFPYQMDLPSPRVGDVPPALSPLDSFALQSRMLARKFELESQGGRRISRLPTNTVAQTLANRGGYFQNINGGGPDGGIAGVPEVQEDALTSPPTAASDGFVPGRSDKGRPVSQYPTFESIDARASVMDNGPQTAPPVPRSFLGETTDYFNMAAPRTSSPEPVDGTMINVEAPSPAVPSLSNSIDSVQSSSQSRTREGTIGSLHSQRSQKSLRSDRGLAPPQSPRFPKSPRSMQSIRSVRQDSGDDDSASFNGAQAVLSSRKFSNSSNTSTPHSPFSPYMSSMHRSPSTTSEYSINGPSMPGLQRPPTFSNFSRPLSSAGSIGRPSMDHRPSLGSRPSISDARPSNDLPLRQQSAINAVNPSNPSSRQNSSDDVHHPTSQPRGQTDPNDSQSYVYAKYALPRGRNVDRTSSGRPATNEWILQQFDWVDGPSKAEATSGAQAEFAKKADNRRQDSQTVPDAVWEKESQSPGMQRDREESEASIPRPSSSWERQGHSATFRQERENESSPQRPVSAWARTSSANREKEDRTAPKLSALAPPVPNNMPPVSPAFSDQIHDTRTGRSFIPEFTSTIRSHSADARTSTYRHSVSASVQTESTDRTIRASVVPLHQRALSTDLTPDEHLEIGIQAHSAGQLTKSTYHLRRAAHAGLPTGMMLYALACRHGWGMRANQEDGVMWLRRAIDSSSTGRGGKGGGLEDAASTLQLLTSLPNTTAGATGKKGVAAAQEAKSRKAQLALAVYELGISYMNGWGCAKDKALAVRCYEVAGSWGDCDALAEAGFCYTQGVGVKKDLKRAAAFYRKAADGGMSMAGNSWIYKPKYMDSTAPSTSASSSPVPPGSSHSAVSEKKDRKDKTNSSRTPTKTPTEGEEAPKSRSRARSIFGGRRKDKDKPAALPLPPN